MGYIMNLRKYVCHEPIIGLGATTLVFNDKNELLLNLRTDTNTWGLVVQWNYTKILKTLL